MRYRNKKPIFFCGLGEKTSAYKFMSKDFNIIPIDWNNIKIPRLKSDVVVGFSFGGILACEYALKNKVKTLVLCSMTTGVESLEKVRADKVFFLIGEKERWVIKDTKRLLKTTGKKGKIIIIPKGDHKIDTIYFKKIKEIVGSIN